MRIRTVENLLLSLLRYLPLLAMFSLSTHLWIAISTGKSAVVHGEECWVVHRLWHVSWPINLKLLVTAVGGSKAASFVPSRRHGPLIQMNLQLVNVDLSKTQCTDAPCILQFFQRVHVVSLLCLARCDRLVCKWCWIVRAKTVSVTFVMVKVYRLLEVVWAWVNLVPLERAGVWFCHMLVITRLFDPKGRLLQFL